MIAQLVFLAAIAAGAVPQLQLTLDPKKVTALQKGEIARCYKRGGLTRQGQYQVLVAITSKSIFFKSQARANTLRMSEGAWDAVLSAIRATDEDALFSRPREYKVPHSASDGTDIYISFRKGGKTVRWDNVRFDPPEKGLPLLTLLENIEFGRAP